MKKFLAIILAFTILLALPMVAQCSAMNINEENENVLVNKDPEIKEKFYELTGMEIKKGPPLYRASRDSFDAEVFHEKCDGHTNTVVIIKVAGGDIIGGYTSAKWESSELGQCVRDEKAFLFSLTKNKIYKIKSNKINDTIRIHKIIVVEFLSGLYIGSENSGYSYVGLDNSNYEGNGDDPSTFIGYPSLREAVDFDIEDYEVYEVE